MCNGLPSSFVFFLFFSRFVESCKMCPVMASSCWRTHWSKEKQRENCEIWLWRRQRRLRPTCRRRDCRLSSGASSSWNGCSWPAARMAPSPQPSPPLHHRYPSASRRYSTLYSSFTTNVSIRRSAGKRPFRTFSIWVSAVCVTDHISAIWFFNLLCWSWRQPLSHFYFSGNTPDFPCVTR